MSSEQVCVKAALHKLPCDKQTIIGWTQTLWASQPYCKIAFVVEAGIAQRQAAALYLQELERLGVLSSEMVGRERIYRNPALVAVLGGGEEPGRE